MSRSFKMLQTVDSCTPSSSGSCCLRQLERTYFVRAEIVHCCVIGAPGISSGLVQAKEMSHAFASVRILAGRPVRCKSSSAELTPNIVHFFRIFTTVGLEMWSFSAIATLLIPAAHPKITSARSTRRFSSVRECEIVSSMVRSSVVSSFTNFRGRPAISPPFTSFGKIIWWLPAISQRILRTMY